MTQDTPPSPFVIKLTADSLDSAVWERSEEVPVVVDFWAEWCAPCRMLTPVLEKLADEYQGRFILVKANTEEVPEVAGQFNVQGIPAVFAVVDRQVVDTFNGAIPEPMLRQWLDRVTEMGTVLQIRHSEKTSPAEAEMSYRKLAEENPQVPEHRISLARVLIAQGKLDESRSILTDLGDNGFLNKEGERLLATLEIQSHASDDLQALRKQAADNPADMQLQLALAKALAAKEHYEEALQVSLAIVSRDKKGVGEPARELMVEVFRVLPEDSELIGTYRRKLSSALY